MQILFGLYYVVLTMKILSHLYAKEREKYLFSKYNNEMPIKFVSWYFFWSEMTK